MSRRRIAAFAALTGLTLAACGSSNDTGTGASGNPSGSANSGPATGEPYQIGFTSDLSAQFAANGTGLRNGFNAYFDYLNKHGGINNHPVTTTVLDDAAKTDRGLANVTQLVTQQHVSAIAGFLVSNICGAAAPVAKTNRVPILCNAVSGDLLSPVQQYVYTSRGLQVNEARPMLDMAKTLVTGSSKKMAVITLASAASSSLREALKTAGPKDGWEVVADEVVPLTANDVSAQTSTVLKGKPDVVVGALHDPLAILFMRTLASQGASVPFIDYDGATLTALGGLKSPNYYMTSSITVDGKGDSAGLKHYREVLAASGLDPATSFLNVGYVQAQVLAEALKKCSFPCTGEQLQAKLDQLNVETDGITAGPLTFTATDHEALHAVNMYVWDSANNGPKVAKANLKGGSK
jgi:branched-chain amino acid transport system substrate-binding protein